MEQLGTFLRNKREEKNLSVRQLAKFTGVSPAYISQLENNYRKNPTPRVLRSLCEGLGIEYEQFLNEINHLSSLDVKEGQLYYDDCTEKIAVHETEQADLYDLFEGRKKIFYKGNVLSDEDREKVKTILQLLLE